MKDNEIYKTIDELLTILENNFRYKFGEKISYQDIFDMMNDLYVLLQNYENSVIILYVIFKYYVDLCGYGGTGRRARFRF